MLWWTSEAETEETHILSTFRRSVKRFKTVKIHQPASHGFCSAITVLSIPESTEALNGKTTVEGFFVFARNTEARLTAFGNLTIRLRGDDRERYHMSIVSMI